ncbi:MAG: Glucosamine-phosphate N-acetyltransferase-like protein [Bogoriella megaspora]|nr:MAG: Glucosamine-phosphate N-acetyltransferase-like protein [Bogoriella megaspora]
MTTNGTTTSAPLFSPHLISPDVQAALPEGYTCRPLQKSDYHKGFLDVLRVLTQVGDIAEERWDERYEWMVRMTREHRRKENICRGAGRAIEAERITYWIEWAEMGTYQGYGYEHLWNWLSVVRVPTAPSIKFTKLSNLNTNLGAPPPSLSSPSPKDASVASPTGPSTEQAFERKSEGHGSYFVLVIIDQTSKIVGTGTLVVERKFIHDLGIVGHIEDIAVAKDQQGKKLGLRIINALDYIAAQVGCYKSILDCSEANEGFYKKCGFKRAGLEMAHYYEKKSAEPSA